MNLHVLRHADSKKLIFGMSSVCVSVCVSDCGHHNSKNNWASSTKFGMRSLYNKNLGRYCIWAKSANGCGLCLETTIRFLGEKGFKNALYKFFSRQTLLQITIRNFWCKNIFDRPTGVASALTAQFGFLVKSALKMRCTKCFTKQKLLQIEIRNFYTMQHFSISCTIMEL